MSTTLETSPALEKILPLVMELTVAERAELINRLDALHNDEQLTPEEWEVSWVEECERRMADLEAGRTKLVSWEEIKASWAERK